MVAIAKQLYDRHVFPRVSEKYDAFNHLDQLIDYAPDSTPNDLSDNQVLASFDYSLNKDGSRSGVVESFDTDNNGTLDTTDSFAWQYDNLGRLISESYDSGNNGASAGDYDTTYAFDLAGNRITKITDNYEDSNLDGAADDTVTYNYDANDRLLSEINDVAGTTNGDTYTSYEYGPSNSATHQTGKTVREGLTATGTLKAQTTYSYDATGRMSKVEIDSNGDGTVDTTTTYTYNASGLRVNKTTGGVTTEYLFDTNNPTGYAQVLEEYVNDVLKTTYTLGNDVIAQQSPTQANGDTLTFLYGGHGSTRALLNQAAQIVQRYAYDAYGNMLTGDGLPTANAALTSFLYSGEATSAVTGLQYLRSRYYNPNTGRFTRRDTYAGSTQDPLSLHKYLYADANPIMGVDPTGQGLISLSVGIAIRVSLEAIAGATLAEVALTGFGYAYNSIVNARNVSGIGGLDVTSKLYSVRNEFEKEWRSATAIKKQNIANALVDYWPWSVLSGGPSALNAWDINEFAFYTGKKDPFTDHNSPGYAPNTITFEGLVYFQSEADYFLWGLVNHLAYKLGIGGSQHDWPHTQSLIRVYRSLLYPWQAGSGRIEGRIAWARAGWDAATQPTIFGPVDAALLRATPNNTPYTGLLSVLVGDPLSNIGFRV